VDASAVSRTRWVAACAAALLLAGCSAVDKTGAGDPTGPSPSPSEPAVGRTVEETAPTPSLANNIVGDAAERDILVHLPPSYDTSQERYPVVYFLEGSDERVGQLRTYADELWAEMQREGRREFIIVEEDGRSKGMGNNFYANSPVAGNAEDALTQDLVAYIDANYRTIPEVSARGLSGFSMGGSGTINAGLRHPDVYAAIYAFSPGLLTEDDGLEGFLHSNGAWKAYGAAFSPDPAAPFPHQVAITTSVPLAEQDPAVVAAWESGFGNLRAKVADYLALPDKLTAIRISYGTGDSYPWIPEGSAFLLDLFEENGIPATSHVFDGGHGLDFQTFPEDYVTYFSENLAG
jgi:S-formylglutathione hydrolase FrmB